jgi:hypothetical protein
MEADHDYHFSIQLTDLGQRWIDARNELGEDHILTTLRLQSFAICERLEAVLTGLKELRDTEVVQLSYKADDILEQLSSLNEKLGESH